jgi:hypothetical protein
VIVLPDAHDTPAKRSQASVGVSIPSTVRHDLRTPPSRVVLGPSSMARTAMPETAIHKDSNLLTHECDIDRALRTWQ